MPNEAFNNTRPVFLIVDDEEDIRLLLRGFLERTGSEVLVAGDAQGALEICERFPRRIDALVTDVRLVGLSGFDLAELAAMIRPEMPILFISGSFRAQDDAVMQHIAPRRAFLQKPFTANTLVERLEAVMSRPIRPLAQEYSRTARAS